jgi:hypothetical protein
LETLGEVFRPTDLTPLQSSFMVQRMGKFLDFLFGKDPDIFNTQGQIQHKLPKARWEAWEKRFKDNPQYNWRLHKGTLPSSHSPEQKK